jgi:hypothetical protein
MAFETYVGYETRYKSISNAAVPITHNDWGWTAGAVERATRIYITPYEAAVCVLWTGAPTAVVGHQIAAGATMELTGARNIQALQLIRHDGTDTVVTITLEA